MQEALAPISDVGEADFEQAVIARSRRVPVLVDFWAPWCGPCRRLGPVLEKLVGEQAGRIALAKVNSDQNPELSASFGVRGIPHVLLFKDGEAIDGFSGALPEEQVRAFLRQHLPAAADKECAAGEAARTAGDAAAAAAAYGRALAADPAHAGAHLGLARLALAGGRDDEVERHLAAISPLAAEADAAAALRQGLELARSCRAAGGEAACRARLEKDAGDLDARIALGACLAAAGRYPEALDELLAAVRRDKKHAGEAARKAMLTIFQIVGVRSPLADEYRGQLALALH
jgi:putative thioredoxin